jgi:ketosteroid isomerase-like protein
MTDILAKALLLDVLRQLEEERPWRRVDSRLGVAPMARASFFVIVIASLFVVAVAACGGGSTPTAGRPASSDPAAVITAIQARQNAGDVDGVMALLSDNAVFYNAPGQVGGPKLATRAGIRAWVQRQVDTSTTAETSDIKVSGDTVTFSVKATRNGSVIHQGQEKAIVKDGKIVERTFL